jgi:GGDEF domain-containing protein
MGSQVLSSNFRRKGDIITHERLFSNGTDGQPEGSTGRLGGDEFGVIVSLKAENGDRPQDPEEQMANTLCYLTCLLDEFSDDMNSTTIIPKFGFSIGSAIWYPEHPVDPSTLVHMADTAMYKNKDEHRA